MTDRDTDPEPQPCGVLPSRRRHEDADPPDPEAVLDRVRGLQVRAWRDVGDGQGIEHLAPAAEEFHDCFGVGADPDHIAAGDADGVAMAAIQGLADRIDEQATRIERQERQLRQKQAVIEEQRTDLETLRERLESLQSRVARLQEDPDERG